MRRPALRLLAVSLVAGLSSLSGCGGANPDELENELGAEVTPPAEPGAEKADHLSVTFSTFDDPAGLGAAGQKETRKVITSATGYKALFGHAAPSAIDWRRDWVIFYSAGVKGSDGYDAQVTGVELSATRRTLKVTTALESPGPACAVTQALSVPHTLVKIKKQGTAFVRFYRDDVERDCTTSSCAAVLCGPGTHCEEQQVFCIRAPCPPIARCVADAPAGPACGGFAALPCPGLGQCAEDTRDGCDPRSGGADCPGVCVCTALAKCASGMIFDRSPEVCGCVPDPNQNPCALVRCAAGTRCEVQNGGAACVSDGTAACGPVTCAAGTVCCNRSCGTCTPPGGFCTQQVCS